MKRKLSKICTPYRIILIIVLTLFSAAFSINDEIVSSPTTPAVVIDGDSLEIGTNRIRLIGIDAPEYMQYCKTPDNKDYPCGKEATEFLKNLVAAKKITCKIHKKDKYKRSLCTCYADNIDINAEMVKNGHAVIYMETPYQEQQQQAKRNKQGIWSGRFMHPRLFRKLKEEENQTK